MAQFKVKYKTRAHLQRAIQQEISSLGLIDDGTMRASIRVSSVVGDLNQLNITINAIYYYMFQDLGATGAGAGRNVDIRPNYITQKAIESANGQRFLDETIQQYMEWLTEEYPILEVAKLKINPNVILTYNLFGDAEGKWNGIFEYNEAFKVNWN